MEVFAAKRKAQSQRKELKQWVSLTLGQSAWEDLLRTEAKIRNNAKKLYIGKERSAESSSNGQHGYCLV